MVIWTERACYLKESVFTPNRVAWIQVIIILKPKYDLVKCVSSIRPLCGVFVAED